MGIRYAIILLLPLFFALVAAAKDQIPDSVKDQLDRMFSSHEIESSGTDDLNDDGIPDYATIVRKKDKNMCSEAVVFWGKPGKTYQYFTKSKELQTPQRLPELYISAKKKSLFISVFRNTPSEGSTDEYQFQLRNGDLLLIGVASHVWSPLQEEKEGDVSTEGYEYKSSYNLLTGQETIIERRKNKKTTKTVKHDVTRLRSLKEFSFDE